MRGCKGPASGCHVEPLKRAIPTPRLLGESAEASVAAAVRSLPLSRVGLRLPWAEGTLPLPESTGGFGEKQKTHRLSGHSGLNCDPLHPLQTLLIPLFQLRFSVPWHSSPPNTPLSFPFLLVYYLLSIFCLSQKASFMRPGIFTCFSH